MAFEDLLKNRSTQTTKPNIGLVNLSSSLAIAHHDQALKREELLQSIMICQGEYDYLALQLKLGKTNLLNDLLNKKSLLIEKNIIFFGLSGAADPADLSAVNRQSNQLTNYRMELEAIKQAQQNQGQYTQTLLDQIKLGIDLEGVMIEGPDQYLTVIADKLKFGGIIDQGRVSRLCGFASVAAKNGDLVLSLKAYSIAGMIFSIKDDFKKILKKAKKQKNPQSQEAEDLLNNFLPKSNKK